MGVLQQAAAVDDTPWLEAAVEYRGAQRFDSRQMPPTKLEASVDDTHASCSCLQVLLMQDRRLQ